MKNLVFRFLVLLMVLYQRNDGSGAVSEASQIFKLEFWEPPVEVVWVRAP